jgi:hypothetical protein
MASITPGEMADCDWLRSTFSGPLFPAFLACEYKYKCHMTKGLRSKQRSSV